MSERTPYDVFESIHGKYNPDVTPVTPFSVWLRAERAQWLAENPGVSMLDGHIFHDADLVRFHEWVVRRAR
jgi:hypothetical protein